MRSATLDLAGIRTSALGFGCASILGAVGAAQARRALETAFEAGIRHFDLARSYGFGQAESFFGRFARGKRDRLTIATKFGILPSPAASGLALVKPVARALFGLVPRLKTAMRSRIGGLSEGGHFDPATARQSVEASLKALGTDYVDFLLMHDCRQGGFEPAAIQELAQELKRAGKIRAFGLATSRDETLAILRAGGLTVDLAQFGDNFLSWRKQPPLPRPIAVIRHSPFRFRLEESDPVLVGTIRRLLAEAGEDAADPSVWRELSLAMAFRAEPRGPVVCSMFDPNHISRNVAIANGGRFPEAMLAAVTEAAA